MEEAAYSQKLVSRLSQRRPAGVTRVCSLMPAALWRQDDSPHPRAGGFTDGQRFRTERVRSLPLGQRAEPLPRQPVVGVALLRLGLTGVRRSLCASGAAKCGGAGRAAAPFPSSIHSTLFSGTEPRGGGLFACERLAADSRPPLSLLGGPSEGALLSVRAPAFCRGPRGRRGRHSQSARRPAERGNVRSGGQRAPGRDHLRLRG